MPTKLYPILVSVVSVSETYPVSNLERICCSNIACVGRLIDGAGAGEIRLQEIVANRGVVSRKTVEGLQHQVGCLNLLTNAIILWNGVIMAEALAQLLQEGYTIDPRDMTHIWLTRFEHINVYGRYEFNTKKARRRNGLRRLRDPDSLDP